MIAHLVSFSDINYNNWMILYICLVLVATLHFKMLIRFRTFVFFVSTYPSHNQSFDKLLSFTLITKFKSVAENKSKMSCLSLWNKLKRWCCRISTLVFIFMNNTNWYKFIRITGFEKKRLWQWCHSLNESFALLI